MSFNLSTTSLSRLSGVNPKLVAVVKRAITYTTIDFGVSEGLRTLETQKKYVAEGKSQTLNSNHLKGEAVDLAAFINGKANWELKSYCIVADAMARAAREENVAIRWGGAWQVNDIRLWKSSMSEAMDEYVTLRKKEGKKIFIDAPHFELSPK